MEKLKNIWTNCQNNKNDIFSDAESLEVLETFEEKRQRWRSIKIVYFTMFLMTLGFSIVLTGVWPYLDKLDPKAGKEFMGFAVAANPFGQLLFSPLIGWWANKAGSIRLPLLTTLALFTIASGIYSSLHLFDSYRKYWMLWARFLVGVSSANIAASRSYVSAATKLSERTTAVSMLALTQVLGFAVGPALQAAVTPLGKDGFDLGPLRLNMFTACGWINCFLGAVNFVFFLPFCFKERKIAAKEAMVVQGKASEKEAWKALKPDKITCWTLIVAFFVMVFNFVLLETLATSLTMDQFAWTRQLSMKYMGILMSVGAVVACLVFSMIGPLTKILEERRMLLWGGFLFTMLGSAMCIPWGPHPPQLAIFGNIPPNGEEIVGCPVETQPWCEYTPALTIVQFLISYACVSIGYPLGTTLIQTIFSKILGPRPQGVWMGLITGAGSLSRVMGPIYVTYVYSKKGTYWTFGSTTTLMVISMIWIWLVYDRLQPPSLAEPKELQFLNVENTEKNRACS